MPKRVCSKRRSASSTAGQRAALASTTWADSAVPRESMLQMCRSCTERTPSTVAIARPTSGSDSPSGTPSSRVWTTRRSSDSVENRISPQISMVSIGSIGVQPVYRMTTPEASAATEPSRSPITCSSAPRVLRSPSPRVSSQATTMFSTSPPSATTITASPATSRGLSRRSTACHTSPPTTASMNRLLTSAASASTRRRPYEWRLLGARCATRAATAARPSDMASVSMWPASPSSASEPDHQPAIASTAAKPRVSASASGR